MQNFGSRNETEIQFHLNNKRFSLLSNHWKSVFKILYSTETFTFLNKIRRIKCEKTQDYIKPDIIISFGGEKRYISIKSGRATNVHTEKIETFLKFLQELGVTRKTINTILLCHYGDGTLDGTGKIRLDWYELYQKYKDRILEANDELNDSTDFVKKVIKRTVFQGVDEKSHMAEYLYFGDQEYGTIVSFNQMNKYIDRKPHNWDFYENIHIGPIVLRPHGRYAHKQIVSEKRRNEIQCNWPNLHADLDYIVKRYGY